MSLTYNTPIKAYVANLVHERNDCLKQIEMLNLQIGIANEALLGNIAMYHEVPLHALDLNFRCQEAMFLNRIQTVGQLIDMTEKDVMKLKGVGKTTLSELKIALRRSNLSFKV